MVLLPLILGIVHYQFLEELVGAIRYALPAQSGVETAMMRIYVSTFVVCLFSLIFGLGISWGISSPIRRLIRTTREIATGNLSRTVPVNTGDEFGDLGDSFNAMIESLNQMFTERNRYILECYTGGLIIVDERGQILAANTAAEQILNRSMQELISRSVGEVLTDRAGTEQFAEIVQNSIRRNKFVSSQEISFQSEEGKDFPLVVTTSPLRDAGDGKTGVVINFRDLTEIKAFYQQINRADRLAAIGTLAAGVAHEIRNPLGSIKGLAQMLSEDSPEDSQMRRYADVIVREVNRLDRVVRELLEFAQDDTREMRPWNINQILREVVALARWQLPEEKAKTIRIHEKYGEVPPFPMREQRITRAFLNLLVNAFDSCPPDGAVVVSSKHEAARGDSSGTAVIVIANTGETVAPEILERMFEPFFSTKSNGTGLGLPIASQAIASHGGTIDVKSEDRLTAFTIRFPIRTEAMVASVRG